MAPSNPMRPVMIPVALTLVCAALALVTSDDLLGTEFGGGQLTGPLVRLCLAGGALLVVCAVLAYVRPRIAAVLTAVAALLCLPLFLYRVAPSTLSWVSSAPASALPAGAVVYDRQAIAGLFALGALIAVHLRTWRKAWNRDTKHSHGEEAEREGEVLARGPDGRCGPRPKLAGSRPPATLWHGGGGSIDT